jgi:hypothetical protein
MRVVCWHAGMHMPLLAELSRMRGGIVAIHMAVLADLRPGVVATLHKSASDRRVCEHNALHFLGLETIDMAVLADLRPVPVEVCRKPTWLGGGLVVTMHFNKDWNLYTSDR